MAFGGTRDRGAAAGEAGAADGYARVTATGRRVLVAGAALVATASLMIWMLRGGDERRVPRQIAVVEPLADLSATFTRSAVVSEAADRPVRAGGIRPHAPTDQDWTYRRAIVAPPPAVLRFRVPAPPGAVLRFGIGVEAPGKRDRDAPGVGFTVSVDGRRVFSRTVNPAATRHDRRWFDEAVPLAGTGDVVEVTLATDVEGDASRAVGLAGWSYVRVLRESARDRQAADAGPSVLVLLVDTLRADRLGCYGAQPSPSPALDRLAARGLVFEHAVAQAPWTLPSVASIFTGLHPRSHGAIGDTREATDAGGERQHDPGFLPDALVTLAEQAAAAGVTTTGVAANPLVSRDTNLVQGFERFVQMASPDRSSRWPRASAVNDELVAWLRANRGRRFLAYLHYMDVHDPYEPPPDLRPAAPPGVRPAVASGQVGMVAERVNTGALPPLGDVEIGHLRALYDAGIRSWDAALGRLLGDLAALGVLDSTVIVVTADHGEEFQEHGRLKHGTNLYDETIRVPLVVAGPGLAARRVATQVQGIDLFPTLGAILGVEVPPGLPGRNVLASADERPAYSETRWGIAPDGRAADLVSARTPEWKLIQAPALGHSELYALGGDPGERRNVFGEAPDGAALAARLVAWQAEAPPPPLADGHAVGLRQKLRELGYLE